jgi:hypothetical protein
MIMMGMEKEVSESPLNINQNRNKTTVEGISAWSPTACSTNLAIFIPERPNYSNQARITDYHSIL